MATACREAPGEGSPVSLEDFRQYHENDKQWACRREFLARHMHAYPGRRMDQLIALSVVWSNIVFIGNRYGEQLTQKVHQMADGIEIDMPSYELVPGAKATKRPATSDATEPPQKKKFGPRPRFAPVHFVVSTIEDDKQFQRTEKAKNDTSNEEKTLLPHNSSVSSPFSDHSEGEKSFKMELNCSPYVYDPYMGDEQSKGDCTNFMTKVEQDYSAKFESHYSNVSRDFRSNVLDAWKDKNTQGRKGIGFVKPPKRPGKPSKEIVSSFLGRTQTQTLDKPSFISHLSGIVKQNMQNPQLISGSTRINYTHMLSQSVQACKTNPEYIYVSLKEIPPSIFPRPKNIPSDGFACEVRCQDVYLATGYSWTRIGARDKAAEMAIQLLLKPMVKVISAKRRFGSSYREDLVACSSDSPRTEFPPALKQDNGHVNDSLLAGQQSSETIRGASTKPWTEFILTENACDAIGILNNSATLNKMTVEYKYEFMPSHTWRCSVYVQDHCVAEAYGNKKTSKHAAAEQAVKVFKSLQPNQQRPDCTRSSGNGAITSLKDIVICENGGSPVCILNATAQFNKVSVEYVFERMAGVNWKCQVFIEQELVAEAIGIKKTVKHEAADAALMALKKTQPVIVNNLKKSPTVDAISRNQIRGLSNEEAFKKQIKEDNIGNQLLRKMGWTGGGLGKGGEGIAEPISVKEQFSREGLGLTTTNQKITKRDIENIIGNYAGSDSQDDLKFSRELSNEERKHIHQIAQKYGLKSKSYGQGNQRFLVVSRKRNREDLIYQLRQEGQVGSYALVMPNQ
ncbi:NF-kappa-B-repressing factor [Dendropsophus ebraccatus]|uniref:NF-kappa-B-repressing factor n=1 Tax=Dendropsophus ebraccatus TaxID=150705 RepID=UPI00383125EB